jgi:biopolymer transport protein ExbD
LIIQIDEFNAYNVIISGVDSPAGSKQDLIVKLTDFQAGTNAGERATKLVVDAHENCIHSAVVDALDAGREAGFENFEVRTVEQFD